MDVILSKKFVRTFIVSFLVFLALLVLQVVSHFFSEMLLKEVPFSMIAKFVLFTALSLFVKSFISAFLIATILTFKSFSQRIKLKFKRKVLSGVLISLSFSLLLVGFNNWILPKANLEVRMFLFDMQKSFPSDFRESDNESLFEDDNATMSISKLYRTNKNVKSEISTYKWQIDSVLSIMPERHAVEMFEDLMLEQYKIQFPAGRKMNSLPDDELKTLDYQLLSATMQLRKSVIRKTKIIEEMCLRLILPFELILFFVVGVCLGFYYKNQKSFLLIFAGLLSMSLLFGIKEFFINLVEIIGISYVLAILLSLFVFALIVILFFFILDKKYQRASC